MPTDDHGARIPGPIPLTLGSEDKDLKSNTEEAPSAGQANC